MEKAYLFQWQFISILSHEGYTLVYGETVETAYNKLYAELNKTNIQYKITLATISSKNN